MIEVSLRHAAVVLQSAHRSHDDHRGGLEACHAALDIEELLRAQIGGKARFRYGVVAQLQRHARRGDGVAAVGDVRERAAVDERRRALQRLHQVRFERVLQKRRHSALGLEVVGRDGLAVIGIRHNDSAEPGLKIFDIAGEAQHRHDLAGHGNVKPVLSGYALHPAAEAIHDVPQLPIVHIHGTLPGDLLTVDAEGVALLDMVIQHRSQQVVGRTNSVKIARKVEVNVLHGDDLGITAAGGAALDAEHGAEAWLPQGDDGVFTDLP